MKKHSISFVILLLLLSGFLGAIMGSLLETVFGLSFLNYELLPKNGIEIEDFYILKKLNLQLTPATLIGIMIAIYFLYKYNNTI
jgi:predicted membrane chloride channel (bestrophin family)